MFTSSKASIIGWDIGGAHLKAARIEAGVIVAVEQVPCRLWMGLEHLDRAFAELQAAMGPAEAHAVTMTGELVDLFPGRAAGVAALTAAALRHLGGFALYAGRAGFIRPEAAAEHAADIASANWHATAALVAAHCPAALLVDIGSTTADLIPVLGGRVLARGYSDVERLVTGELLYTGATRSSLMGFPEAVPFLGRLIPPMQEYFATMADVHRILGTLPEGVDQHDTADGGPKTVAASRLRLSRVIGVEIDEATEADWRDLAAVFAERQIRRVQDAAMLALSGHGLAAAAPVVACGAGRFIVAELARRLARPLSDLADLLPVAGAGDLARRAGQCAPAVAVGLLAGGG